MQATTKDIATLDELQELDRLRLRAEGALKSLPHAAQLEALKGKIEQIEAKRAQVEAMRTKEENRLMQLGSEDEQLAQRQNETQAKIEEKGGDYRQVQSLTRDLEGMVKRRETLEFEMGKSDTKLDEIAGVAKQVDAALAQLLAQRDKVQADFEKKSTELKATIAQAQAKRETTVAALPADILAAYQEAVARCGGVGLAHLAEDKCSACRSVIEPNRLLQVQKEAPLSHCPSCHRLLVVE